MKEKIGMGTQIIRWGKGDFIAGPFTKKEAKEKGISLSRFFGRPKPDGSTRPILDLSDDSFGMNSVNGQFPKTHSAVEYMNFLELVAWVKLSGKSAFVWAKDLKDGYFNVHIAPEHGKKLGFEFDGKIWFYKVMPFGFAPAAKIFTFFMFWPLWLMKKTSPETFYHKIEVPADFRITYGNPQMTRLMRSKWETVQQLKGSLRSDSFARFLEIQKINRIFILRGKSMEIHEAEYWTNKKMKKVKVILKEDFYLRHHKGSFASADKKIPTRKIICRGSVPKINPKYEALNNAMRNCLINVPIRCGNSFYIPAVTSYLDDIIGSGQTKGQALAQYNGSEKILQKLNLKTKESKNKEPFTEQIALGYAFDTPDEAGFIPDDFIDKAIVLVISFTRRVRIQKKEFSSAIGRVRRIGSMVRVANAFARSLEVHLYPWDYERVEWLLVVGVLLSDLFFLCKMLRLMRGMRVKLDFILLCPNNADVVCYTDAATTIGGIGGHFNNGEWFQVKWADLQFHRSDNRDIVWRELAAVVVAILMQRLILKEKAICAWTDSSPAVGMLISMRASLKRPDCQTLINWLCETALITNFHIYVRHIKGENNTIADALSRFKGNPFETANKYRNMPSHYNATHRNREAKDLLQQCADLCKDIVIAEENLCMNKTELARKKGKNCYFWKNY